MNLSPDLIILQSFNPRPAWIHTFHCLPGQPVSISAEASRKVEGHAVILSIHTDPAPCQAWMPARSATGSCKCCWPDWPPCPAHFRVDKMALGVQSWAGLRCESRAHGASPVFLRNPRSGLIVNILSWQSNCSADTLGLKVMRNLTFFPVFLMPEVCCKNSD